MMPAIWAGAASAVLLATNLGSMALAARRLRRRDRLDASRTEPVTIIRPACGLEPFVEMTLASSFALDHPTYEVIFCVDRTDDPVVPIIRRLIAAHSGVEARLLIGEDRVSGNPKLNNCVKGWQAAQHEWIVLADSNVLLPPDYLEQLLKCWRPDTGLVCSTPLGTRADGFWAAVECAFLNTHQARWQYAGEACGFGFAQGKSMLWHRPFLERHGGIRALAAEIAEDAAATKLVRRAGKRVRLVDSPFEQPLGRRSAAQVWRRQLRWARLRRITFPLFFAPEIATVPALPLLLALFAAQASGGNPPLAAAAIILSWYGAETALALAKGWPLSWRIVAAFPVRDAMMLGIWLLGWTTGTTVWRGNTLPLAANGKLADARAEAAGST